MIAGEIKVGGNLALVSAPGMDRIDINRDGSGCQIVWRNNTIRTPSAVSKGDAANGLIYTYTKPKDPVRRRRLVLDRRQLSDGEGRRGASSPVTVVYTTTTTPGSRSGAVRTPARRLCISAESAGSRHSATADRGRRPATRAARFRAGLAVASTPP